MMRSLCFVVFTALVLGACASTDSTTDSAPPAQAQQTPPANLMPIDTNVRIDTLANGLVYYLRRNTEPMNRAELRLVINAGSVLEDDDQLGLAHFLEHMLFNGTERFPEMELVNFLERTGMEFGPDVNAYTSFDETVYMLQIPTDSTEIVENAFQVLEDWASAATLSDEEIDKERGVVVEEWRLSDQNASGRIRDQILPILLADSRYEHRLPIGDTTIIKNAPPETVRRYYNTWYRPDLMAVVAVGDFDIDQYEALIREHFSNLTNPTDATPRPTYDVPVQRDTRIKVATDPEYPIASVQVGFKRQAHPLLTEDDYRRLIVNGSFNSMLNARLNEIERRADAPFLSGGVSDGGFVRPMAMYSLTARVEEDKVLTGLEALLDEVERVRQFGFTATEWEREQRETLRSYRRAYDERENRQSSAFASEYVDFFLEQTATPGIAYEYELVQRLLADITLDEINTRAAALLQPDGRIVIVTMPEKDGLTPPTEAQLAAVLDAVQDKTLTPYEDAVQEEELLADIPAPVEVTSTESIPEIDVEILTLANGVRVAMKPTDFKADEVRFVASSPGGTSLVPDEDYFSASQAASLVSLGGIGAFDRTGLEKHLAGKVVGVAPYISELEEGLQGVASPEDLETLFQLIYLHFTAPRADPEALAVQQNNQRSFLLNRSNTPTAALQDTLIAALYGDHPRRGVPTMADIDALSLETAMSVYQDRFADASDFTFTFVGNFDPAYLTQLAQTYLGTLPSTGRVETWRDVSPDPPAGVIEKIARKGQEDQSIVYLYFSGKGDPSLKNRMTMNALQNVLDIVMREELREERSGIYSPFVNTSFSVVPDSAFSVTIGFGCDPARAEELAGAVFGEIDKLKADGPSDDTVVKAQEQLRRSREESLEQNNFWVGALDYYLTAPYAEPQELLTFNDRVAALTAADLQTAVKEYLRDDQYVQVILYPEAFGE